MSQHKWCDTLVNHTQSDDVPAIQAVRKQAQLPAIMARTTTLAMSARLVGAMAPKPPKLMPMELMLLKPHSAYVAMISARFCKTMIV